MHIALTLVSLAYSFNPCVSNPFNPFKWWFVCKGGKVDSHFLYDIEKQPAQIFACLTYRCFLSQPLICAMRINLIPNFAFFNNSFLNSAINADKVMSSAALGIRPQRSVTASVCARLPGMGHLQVLCLLRFKSIMK